MEIVRRERDGFYIYNSPEKLEIARSGIGGVRIFLWAVILVSVFLSLSVGPGIFLFCIVFLMIVGFPEMILRGANAIDYIRFESNQFTIRRSGLLFTYPEEIGGNLSEIRRVKFNSDEIRIDRGGRTTVWRIEIVASKTYRIEVNQGSSSDPRTRYGWIVGAMQNWLWNS